MDLGALILHAGFGSSLRPRVARSNALFAVAFTIGIPQATNTLSQKPCWGGTGIVCLQFGYRANLALPQQICVEGMSQDVKPSGHAGPT